MRESWTFIKIGTAVLIAAVVLISIGHIYTGIVVEFTSLIPIYYGVYLKLKETRQRNS